MSNCIIINIEGGFEMISISKVYLVLIIFLFTLGCANLEMQDKQYRETLIDVNPQWSTQTKQKIRDNNWDNDKPERQVLFSVGNEEPTIIDVKNSCDSIYERRRRTCFGQIILWKWNEKEPQMSIQEPVREESQVPFE
jgi:hypothetical protein